MISSPTPADRIEHTPDRPKWDCRACGKTWPCDPAREQLVAGAAADGTSLRIYLWLNLEEAVQDMPTAPAGELFERFIAWYPA